MECAKGKRTLRKLGLLAFLASAGLALGTGCADEGGGAGSEQTGGVPGSGGAESTGGTTSVPSGGSQPGGSGGGTDTTNPDECGLQGEYRAATEETLPEPRCNYPLIARGWYDLTIEGKTITVMNPTERVPMTGTIDAECEAIVLMESPTYREFRFGLDPETMSGSGTLTVKGLLNDCTATFDLSMTLEEGHL